jgi:hypothetical protein
MSAKPPANFPRNELGPRPSSPVAKSVTAIAAGSTYPTESKKEFAALHASLVKEWKPKGVVQEEAVLTLAQLIWRRRNLSIFQKAAKLRDEFAPFFRGRSIDEAWIAFGQFKEEYTKLMLEDQLKANPNRPQTIDELIASTEEKKIPACQVQAISATSTQGNAQPGPGEGASSKNASLAEEPGPRLTPKLLAQLMQQAEDAFGPAIVQELVTKITDGIDFELAAFGELITPEAYTRELSLALLIEKQIDLNVARLLRLKKIDDDRAIHRSQLLAPYP